MAHVGMTAPGTELPRAELEPAVCGWISRNDNCRVPCSGGAEHNPAPLQATAESCSPLSEMLLQVHPQILGSLSWGDLQSESSRGARARLNSGWAVLRGSSEQSLCSKLQAARSVLAAAGKGAGWAAAPRSLHQPRH